MGLCLSLESSPLGSICKLFRDFFDVQINYAIGLYLLCFIFVPFVSLFVDLRLHQFCLFVNIFFDNFYFYFKLSDILYIFCFVYTFLAIQSHD